MPNFQFGLFGICDGHSGDGAAKSASKLVFSALCLAMFDGCRFNETYRLMLAGSILCPMLVIWTVGLNRNNLV